jgi:Cytidylate kinase
MRAKAAELGMSIEEFARYNREHPEKGYDKWCDDTIEQLAKHNWVVVEGRLPHIFMPYAYRIKLVCSDEIRAVRRQAQEFPDLTFEEVLQRIKERDGNDNARYETLYPGCLWRDGDFDLVVNTERPTPEQTLYYVLREYESFIKSLTPNRILRAVKAPE